VGEAKDGEDQLRCETASGQERKDGDEEVVLAAADDVDAHDVELAGGGGGSIREEEEGVERSRSGKNGGQLFRRGCWKRKKRWRVYRLTKSDDDTTASQEKISEGGRGERRTRTHVNTA
jgi:hypothetical protein